MCLCVDKTYRAMRKIMELLMKLSEIIVPEAIVSELKARGRDEVIEELVEAMSSAGVLNRANVKSAVKAVLQRETKATTGIGKGVALPHAKLKGVSHPIGAIGRSTMGIDFSALDGKPVHVVILLLSDEENPDEHLQAMELIFRHVQQDQFRKWLRQTDSRDEIAELLKESEEIL